ncbi:MAG: pyridoxamine 5'-phosphate oxidase family protein [Acidimicrobiales bacterium]
MSVRIETRDLADTAATYGPAAFLLTDGSDHRPHITAVAPAVDGAVIRCSVGGSAARNIATNPLVSVLWAPVESGGYSFIADGSATSETDSDGGAIAVVVVESAVLHRPAPVDNDSGCSSDCVDVEVSE